MTQHCCVQSCEENLNSWMIFLKPPLAHFLLQLDSLALVWQRGLKCHETANLNSKQNSTHKILSYINSQSCGNMKNPGKQSFPIGCWLALYNVRTTMWRTKLWRTRSAFMGKSWMETGPIVKGFHRTLELSQLINILKSIEVGVVSSHLL